METNKQVIHQVNDTIEFVLRKKTSIHGINEYKHTYIWAWIGLLYTSIDIWSFQGTRSITETPTCSNIIRCPSQPKTAIMTTVLWTVLAS